MRNQTSKTSKLIFDNSDTDKRAGSIILKPGSKKLYLLFRYNGRRVEKSSGLNDTAENRKKLRTWLDRQMEKIEEGRFNYAEAFPEAPEAEKELFSKIEGRNYSPSSKDILIGDYLKKWDNEIVELYESSSKKFDFRAIIKCWIEPYFAKMTFYELTGLVMQKFIGTLKCKIGKNRGNTLSKSRQKNIISVIRTIHNDASDGYHWESPNPFREVKKFITKKRPKVRGIFQFDEWMEILKEIPAWHRPMLEFMMLTGMIHSEISGLQRHHIQADLISIQYSIVRKKGSETLKNEYRIREFPITKRVREILDVVLARTDSTYVFAQPNGKPYFRENFTERIWTPAVNRCKINNCPIPYRPPYSIRHSFVAWSLLGNIDPIRLVSLCGHGSKKMIYEVYGKYTKGLEKDTRAIVNYLGRDYLEGDRKPLPFHYNSFSESFGESQGFYCHNQLNKLDN